MSSCVVESCGASGSAKGFLGSVESEVALDWTSFDSESVVELIVKDRAESARRGRMSGALQAYNRRIDDIRKTRDAGAFLDLRRAK